MDYQNNGSTWWIGHAWQWMEGVGVVINTKSTKMQVAPRLGEKWWPGDSRFELENHSKTIDRKTTLMIVEHVLEQWFTILRISDCGRGSKLWKYSISLTHFICTFHLHISSVHFIYTFINTVQHKIIATILAFCQHFRHNFHISTIIFIQPFCCPHRSQKMFSRIFQVLMRTGCPLPPVFSFFFSL